MSFLAGGLVDGLFGSQSSKTNFINEPSDETLVALYNQGHSLDAIADRTGLLKFEVSRKLGLDDGAVAQSIPNFNLPTAGSSPVASILSEQGSATSANAQKSEAPDQQSPGWLSIHQDMDQLILATSPQPSPGAVDWSGRALNDWEIKVDQALSHYKRAAIDYHRRKSLGRMIL